MKTLTPKQRKAKIDQQVQEIVSRRCSGMAINIMDIGKVFQAAYDAASGVTGQDIEAAVYTKYSELARATAGLR